MTKLFKYFETIVITLNLLYIATFFFGIDLTLLMVPWASSYSYTGFVTLAMLLTASTIMTILPLTIFYLLALLYIRLKLKRNRIKELCEIVKENFDKNKSTALRVAKVQGVFVILFILTFIVCYYTNFQGFTDSLRMVD